MKALASIYAVEPPADAVGRRALWERAGVANDDLSSTVLCAGLRIDGASLPCRILNLCAESGQPVVLTLRQTRSMGEAIDLPGEVWIFENPSVVSVAVARFGTACPPLVCTSGWPSSAAVTVLGWLRDHGVRLNYHGDFDGDGLRIAAHVIARTGASPWRMTAADYLAAVGAGPPVGRVSDAPWDPELGGHLVRVGTTLSEERVAPALLDEIVRSSQTPI